MFQPGVAADEESPSKRSHRKNRIVRFFRLYYYGFVTHKTLRWVLLAAFTVIVGVFIYFASTLRVNEEQVREIYSQRDLSI